MSTIDQNATLVHLFVERAKESGSQNALFTKLDGKFQGISWSTLHTDVCKTAASLKSIGINPGDRVVQIAENSYEWIVCDLAIQMARAIHVPVHAPLSSEQIFEQISDCEPKCIIVGDNSQYAKIMSSDHSLPFDTKLIPIQHAPQLAGPNSVPTLSELREGITSDACAAVEKEALDRLLPASIATILYTSGTTGSPKGVVLSQRNLLSNTVATVEAFGLHPKELRICFLPFSHIFARTCDLYTWILRGSEIGLVESIDTILPDCMRLKPHTINGVPYFFQRVHRYLVEQGKADEEGSLKKILGGEIQLCCSGGAALPDYLCEFFERQGVPLFQGYGLSESSPVIAVNSPLANRRGTVGKPIPGVSVKISDDGEILATGPNIMSGYWNNSEATREVIQDGWLHTGDLGEFDEDGFLKITGRRKEIIVTAGGKNVAPTQIEGLLCEDPMIIQAVVIGDGRNYLTALIVPDPDNIKQAIRRMRILPLSKRWVLNHSRIRSMYEQIINQRLESLSHFEQIRKFYLMDRGFTMETGEMTPKLSLKRSLIEQNCKEIIDDLYGEKPVTKSWTSRIAGVGRSFQ